MRVAEQETLPVRVYRMGRWANLWLRLFYVAPVLGLFASFVAATWAHTLSLMATSFFSTVLSAFTLWLYASPKVTLTKDGIFYSSTGSTLYAPWSNMEILEDIPSGRSIALLFPGVEWQSPRWSRWNAGGFQPQMPLETPSGRPAWEGDLLGDLRQYAPSLFVGR